MSLSFCQFLYLHRVPVTLALRTWLLLSNIIKRLLGPFASLHFYWFCQGSEEPLSRASLQKHLASPELHRGFTSASLRLHHASGAPGACFGLLNFPGSECPTALHGAPLYDYKQSTRLIRFTSLVLVLLSWLWQQLFPNEFMVGN